MRWSSLLGLSGTSDSISKLQLGLSEMISEAYSVPWFEHWSDGQFAGLTTAGPPAEPSLDDTDTQAQFKRIQHQVCPANNVCCLRR